MFRCTSNEVTDVKTDSHASPVPWKIRAEQSRPQELFSSPLAGYRFPEETAGYSEDRAGFLERSRESI